MQNSSSASHEELFDFTMNQFDLLPTSINVTWGYQTLQAAAYSDLFAYGFCLILGMLFGLYFNIRYIKGLRFYLMFGLELAAVTLGISGFHFAYAPSTNSECVCLMATLDDDGHAPTRVAYAALVLVVVNFVLSLLDLVLKFENRMLHTLHILIATATLWVGSMATMMRYRENLDINHTNELRVFTFIAMWSGAMMSLPIPGVINYCLFNEGPYNPIWSSDPAEFARNKEELKRRQLEKAQIEKIIREFRKEQEKQSKKKKDPDKDQKGEAEAMLPSDFISMTIRKARKKDERQKKKSFFSRDQVEDIEGEEVDEKPKKKKSKNKK